uniref:C2H2-type domain-containing protein n=1 Tax=Heliothis virescens TaxID=7102 RepID=A0A2A4JC35_HELVI
MSENYNKPEIAVDVVRLNSDIIDEHLCNSTAVLHDILKDKEDPRDCDGDGEVPSDSDGSEDEGHMCQHCGKIYKNDSTLHAHYLLMHPENELEGQCTECDKKYPSLLSLQKHIRYMHRYIHRCKACYRTFATPELLAAHGKRCSITDTPCPQCSKVYYSQLALQNHMKYKHPHKTNHWCELCRRTFTTHRGLMNHNAKIHPPGATDCSWCEKTFNSVTALQSHVLYKHTEGGSRCAQCHKVFAKKICLRKHLIKNHRYTMGNFVDVTETRTSNEFNSNE